MFSDSFVIELRAVFQAQNYLLRQIEDAISELEEKFSDVDEQTRQIRELEKLMAELEASADWLEKEDFADFDADEIVQLYENRQKSVSKELVKIGYKDWDSFVRQCQIYTLEKGIDPLTPYETLLSEADLKQLNYESYYAQYQWDKLDYIFVGASGIIASLTDYFLVRIPTILTSGKYAGQLGSPITAWLKKYNINQSDDWFAQWAKYLEETCKTLFSLTTKPVKLPLPKKFSKSFPIPMRSKLRVEEKRLD
jgi:hypothetical protein